MWTIWTPSSVGNVAYSKQNRQDWNAFIQAFNGNVKARLHTDRFGFEWIEILDSGKRNFYAGHNLDFSMFARKVVPYTCEIDCGPQQCSLYLWDVVGPWRNVCICRNPDNEKYVPYDDVEEKLQPETNELRAGYVYLAQSTVCLSIWKLGRSKDVGERLGTLNTEKHYVSFGFRVVSTHQHEDCIWAERELHEHFAEFRTSQNRELFMFPDGYEVRKAFDIYVEDVLNAKVKVENATIDVLRRMRKIELSAQEKAKLDENIRQAKREAVVMKKWQIEQEAERQALIRYFVEKNVTSH